MARTSGPLPTQKVTAGALAGALSVVLVWAARLFWQVEITPEVSSSLTVILTFLVSYLTPPAAGEVLEHDPAPGQ